MDIYYKYGERENELEVYSLYLIVIFLISEDNGRTILLSISSSGGDQMCIRDRPRVMIPFFSDFLINIVVI